MRFLLPFTLLLAACNFDSSTAAAIDPFAPDAMDPNAPDADPSAPDGSTVLTCSDWDLPPEILDPCANNIPIEQDSLLLTIKGLYRYNTADGKLTNNLGNDIPSVSTTLGTDPLAPRIMVTNNLHLGPESMLRVVGPRPLIILAWGGIVIEGEIDASSGGDGKGAGANPDLCLPAMPGPSANEGSGGGGGGGLGQAGGKGGDGNADAAEPADINVGGLGGATLPVVMAFHGGCAGANGGDGELANEELPTPGLGGNGGGAVYLLARTMLNFRGSINAGGQGGEATNSRVGGGDGGGSGGMVVLESNVLTLQIGSVIAANGGGGGGGSDMMPNKAVPGVPGTMTVLGSAGGDGEKNGKGAGGLGGARDTAVLDGQDSDSGAGGGGGGFGHIRLRSNNLTNNASVVSPMAVVEEGNSIGNPQ